MTGTPGVNALAGRAEERALLADAIAGLAAGRGGSVLVEGEPGIGKSSLINSVLADAGQLDIDVLRGECDELGRRLLPLSPMLTVLGVDPNCADPRRAQAATALTGPCDPGRDARAAVAPGVDATAASVEILSALVDHMCAVRPVVIAVDDLHSADEASLRFWSRLSRAAAQLPLLLIGVCRPNPRRAELDELREEIAGSPHGLLIPLGPLGGAEAIELAANLVGARPGPRFAQRLESAAGNPLHVREFVDAAVRCGLLSIHEGIAELEDEPESERYGRSAVPLSAVIADHLDCLSPHCREVLRVAATQGVEFTVPEVSRLAGVSAQRLSSLVDEAVHAGVVEQVAQRLRFRHGLIRQALFDEISHPMRLAIYQDAALHLIRSGAATQATAEAVLRALEVADGWELDWLAANARELAYRDPEAAADLLEHAMTEDDAGEARLAEFEDLLIMIYANLARYEHVERIARHVLTTSANPERLGHACLQLARVLSFQAGRFDDALAAATEGMNDPRIPPLWRVRLRARHAVFQQILGQDQRDDADRTAERVLTEARDLGDRAAQSVILHVLALRAGRHGRMAESIELFDRALELTEGDVELTDGRLTMLFNKAGYLYTLGLREQMRETLRAGRVQAERIGSPRLACFDVMAGILAFLDGRWDDAIAEYSQVEDSTIYADMNEMVHTRYALIAVHRDDEPAVKRHLAAIEHCDTTSGTAPDRLIIALGARASAAYRQGRLREAIEILRPIVENEAFRILERADWLPLLIRLASATGDRDLVERTAEAAHADARQESIELKLQTDAWCHGLLTGDPDSVQTAVTHMRNTDEKAPLGFALEDMAVLHAKRGDLENARTAVTEALSIYAGLGASWDARRAAARLRPLGVRLGVRGSRQRPRTGWEALSVTERQVALLATDGLSNPEIASRLLLSRRTVQTHVSHVLAKLGASSRREIAKYALGG